MLYKQIFYTNIIIVEDFPKLYKRLIFTLTDIKGNVVYQFKHATKFELNVQNLPAGEYILNLRSEDLNMSKSRIIVVTK
ncbi:MAG: T9SS type A sorting domain-containing protein [Paludibacter sp.]|nr:T9SS type A sorting domain-containing protein [Paludibacter sp.]